MAKQEPNIGLNYGWAQGESGWGAQMDENLRALGALLHLEVLSRSVSDPSTITPSEGDRYIVPSGAVGAWSGLSGKIVRYIDAAWEVFTPRAGWRCVIVDENVLVRYDGSSFIGLPTEATNADGTIDTVKLSAFAHNVATTSGLTFGHKAGNLRDDNVVHEVADGTVALAASATNYIEVSMDGTVSANSTGFTAGRIPLYEVVTSASAITSISDKRSWMDAGGGAALDVYTKAEVDSVISTSSTADRDRANHTGTQPLSTISDAGTFAAQDYASAPFGNVLKDGGRYDGGVSGFSIYLQGPYTKNNLFNSYNGSTFSEAGKFIHNNSDFGGTSGNMTQTTIDLINATGRILNYARYGVEFFIEQITAGAGSAVPLNFAGGTRYLMTTNSGAAIFGSNSFGTFAAWVRATGSPLGIRMLGFLLEINGAEMTQHYELDPSDGWVFVRSITHRPQGYDTEFPSFYSNHGGGCQVALPYVATGYADTGMHTAPIISRAGAL